MIKFQSIKIQNFLSFNDTNFSFKDNGLYLIEGKNGSGKSSLFEAIAWCLFGKTFKTIKEDKIINKLEEKDCLVNLVFTIDDKKYQVIKTKKHNEYKDTTMLFVKINNSWDNISGKDQLDTHKEIEKILGLNFKVFQQSIMLTNHNKSFAEMTDSDIKEIFDEILDLDVYTKLQDINAINIKELNNKISKVLNDKTIILNNISGFNDVINSLTIDLKDIQKEIDSKKNNALENIKKYETDINILTEEINKIGNINDLTLEFNKQSDIIKNNENKINTLTTSASNLYSSDIVKIESDIKSKELYIINTKNEEIKDSIKIEDIQKQKDVIEELKNNVENLLEEKNKEEVLFKTNKNKINEFIEVIDTITDLSDCPICKQKVPSNHRKSIISNYQNKIKDLHSENALIEKKAIVLFEKIEQIKVKVSNEYSLLRKLQDTYQAYKDYQERLLVINQYKKDIEELLINKDSLIKRIETIENAINVYTINNQTIKEEKDKINTKIEKINSFKSAINNFNDKIKSENKLIENEDKILSVTLDRIESFKLKIENEKAKLKDIENKIKDDEDELKYLQYLDFAFSNQGIKSVLLQNITPILNTIANNFSSDITNGHIGIKFETQTYIKSTKQWKEKFKIDIINKFGGEDYKANSDGERAIIDLCILSSLNYLVSLRSGKAFNISIFDESFGALDSDNTERIIKYLNNKAEDNVIYVVSHDSGFKNYFDDTNIIKVKKIKGYTYIN